MRASGFGRAKNQSLHSYSLAIIIPAWERGWGGGGTSSIPSHLRCLQNPSVQVSRKLLSQMKWLVSVCFLKNVHIIQFGSFLYVFSCNCQKHFQKSVICIRRAHLQLFIKNCAHFKIIICSFLFLWREDLYCIKVNHGNSIWYIIHRVYPTIQPLCQRL